MHRRNKVRGESRVGSALAVRGKAAVDRSRVEAKALTGGRGHHLPSSQEDLPVRIWGSCCRLPGAGSKAPPYLALSDTGDCSPLALTIILTLAKGARALQAASQKSSSQQSRVTVNVP